MPPVPVRARAAPAYEGQAWRRGGGRAEVEPHRGSVTDLGVELDVAPRLLDETVHHAEAESGPLPSSFGAEERLEHALDIFRRNACSRVRHGNQHVGPGRDLGMDGRIVGVEFDGGGLDRQAPALRHRVPRVQGQVEQGRVELRRVDEGAP